MAEHINGIAAMIPQSKRAQASEYYLAHQPNNEYMPDPTFSGDPEEAPLVPKYTNAEWVDETIERFIKRCCRKGKSITEAQASGDFDPWTE